MQRFFATRRTWLFVSAVLLGLACPAGAENSAAPQAKFTPNVKLDLPANTAVELGPFSWQKPEGEGDSGSVTDYSGMVYDPHHHRILLFGGGHATTWTDAIYAFDLTGLAWSALYAPTPARFYQPDNMDRGFWKAGAAGKYPRPVGRHTYDLLVVPNDREELLVLMNGCGPSSVAPGFGYWGSAAGSYDFRTEQWKILPKAPFGSYGAVAEYDPMSKKVIGAAGQHVDLHDPETGASQQILDNVADRFHVTGYSGTMVYFPPDDKMYFIPQNKKVWSLEPRPQGLHEIEDPRADRQRRVPRERMRFCLRRQEPGHRRRSEGQQVLHFRPGQKRLDRGEHPGRHSRHHDLPLPGLQPGGQRLRLHRRRQDLGLSLEVTCPDMPVAAVPGLE